VIQKDIKTLTSKITAVIIGIREEEISFQKIIDKIKGLKKLEEIYINLE